MPDLDDWVGDAVVSVRHERTSSTDTAALWRAAQALRLSDTRMLGRLVRWRIPGISAGLAFDALLRAPPFVVLEASEGVLVSGLVGRIWTLRRDYPTLSGAEEFRAWSGPGSARVLFGIWVEPKDDGGSRIVSETRVALVDREARTGLRLVRPLIGAFHSLIGTEALAGAVRQAEQGSA